MHRSRVTVEHGCVQVAVIAGEPCRPDHRGHPDAAAVLRATRRIALRDLGQLLIGGPWQREANVDVFLGLTPRLTLADVLAGNCTLEEVIIDAPQGFQVVPAASGAYLWTDTGLVPLLKDAPFGRDCSIRAARDHLATTGVLTAVPAQSPNARSDIPSNRPRGG